jgi:hypothetical protein
MPKSRSTTSSIESRAQIRALRITFWKPGKVFECGATITEKTLLIRPETRFVIRVSTGEYLTKVRIINNHLEWEFTTDRDEATRLNDFDSKMVLKRLSTLRENRARREEAE